MSQGASKGDILQHFVKHTEQSNVRRAEIFRRGKNKGIVVALAAAAFAVGSCILLRLAIIAFIQHSRVVLWFCVCIYFDNLIWKTMYLKHIIWPATTIYLNFEFILQYIKTRARLAFFNYAYRSFLDKCCPPESLPRRIVRQTPGTLNG